MNLQIPTHFDFALAHVPALLLQYSRLFLDDSFLLSLGHILFPTVPFFIHPRSPCCFYFWIDSPSCLKILRF